MSYYSLRPLDPFLSSPRERGEKGEGRGGGRGKGGGERRGKRGEGRGKRGEGERRGERGERERERGEGRGEKGSILLYSCIHRPPLLNPHYWVLCDSIPLCIQ